MEGMGLAFYKLNKFDSTLLVADSLFARDRNSPGGHLLKMVIALQSGDRKNAKSHFAEYKKYGSNRSDYRNILEYYGTMVE